MKKKKHSIQKHNSKSNVKSSDKAEKSTPKDVSDSRFEIKVEMQEEVLLSDKEYLAYLEHSFQHMPYHLLHSNQLLLLYEYYTCPKVILKNLNLCCTIREQELKNLQLEADVERSQLKNNQSQYASSLTTLVPIQCQEFDQNDPVITLPDSNINIYMATLNTFYASRCTYTNYLEEFSSILMTLIKLEEEDKENDTCYDYTSRLTDLSETNIEFLKWMNTIFRTTHFAKVLQSRPEELPSLILGRLLKDFSSTQVQGCNSQVIPSGSASAIEWLSEHLATDQANVNNTTKSQFFLNDTCREFDELILRIQEMQVGKSWLIPFNRLTGMSSTSKYHMAIEGEENVSAVYISPKETHLYSVRNSNEGGDVVILNRFFGSKTICPEKFSASGAITSFSLSPLGDKLVVTFEDTSIKILDAINGMELFNIGDLYDKPTCGKITQDGNYYYVATGCHVNIFDLESGEFIETLRGHTDEILCMDLNNEYLVTGGKDNLIIKWKLRTGSIDLKIKTQYDYHVGCVQISKKNDFIVSVENNRYYADVWCASTGSHKHFLMDRGTVKQILMDSDRDRLFTVMEDKIWMWDVKTAIKLCRMNVTKRIKHVDLNINGLMLYVLFNDCTIATYDLCGENTTIQNTEAHSNPVLDLALFYQPHSKKLNILSVAQKENNVFVWSFDDGILQKKIKYQADDCEHLCFTNRTGFLMILDQSPPLESSLNGELPEGRCLKCHDLMNKDASLLWSIILPYNGKSRDYVQFMCMSADDKYLIICYAQEIVLVPIDTPTRYMGGFMEGKEQIRGITISLDCDELITSDANGYIRKWSIADRTLSQKFQVGRWRRNKCQCVYLLGDSRHLIVGSPQHPNWISVHERHPKFSSFPQAIFCKKAVKDGSQSNLHTIQDFDNSHNAIVQQHERIAKNFSASRITTTPDERFIISGDSAGCIRVWDTEKRIFICSYTLEYSCTTLKILPLKSDESFYVILAGDSGGNVTCLEACFEE